MKRNPATERIYREGGAIAVPAPSLVGLRPEPIFVVSAIRRPSTIAGPSQAFVALTRNPHLEPPSRFEPTRKAEGDIVL